MAQIKAAYAIFDRYKDLLTSNQAARLNALLSGFSHGKVLLVAFLEAPDGIAVFLRVRDFVQAAEQTVLAQPLDLEVVIRPSGPVTV